MAFTVHIDELHGKSWFTQILFFFSLRDGAVLLFLTELMILIKCTVYGFNL